MYEPNPKHKEPWQRSARGSLCPGVQTVRLCWARAFAQFAGLRLRDLPGAGRQARLHGPDLMDELGDRVREHPQLIGETETLEGHDRQVRLESG